MPESALAATPHALGALNVLLTGLLGWGLVAIRRGHRTLHPRVMKFALAVSIAFAVGYVAHTAAVGHRRFPGDDWVRTMFVTILATHTVLAAAIVPLVLRTTVLAVRGRFDEHRRIARITFPLWMYVAVTGVVIYAMNQFVRPGP